MRRSIALATAAAVLVTVAPACRSGSSRRAAPASAITSITQAPGAGWTTPVTETSFSGSPPGLRPAVAAPAPATGWNAQPPVMDMPEAPLPPAPPMGEPAFDTPAEPTWTAPAPIESPDALPGAGSFEAPAPIDAPAPADMPAPADAGAAAADAAAAAMDHAKPGFRTFEREGRLWVFREGSEDLATFLEAGEPAKSVTSIGTGPGGLTLRSGDIETIKDYLATP